MSLNDTDCDQALPPVHGTGVVDALRAAASAVLRAPAEAGRRLAAIAPRPDPDFDPFTACAENAPRVREIVLQIGPTPGAANRRGLEGPSGLAWG